MKSLYLCFMKNTFKAILFSLFPLLVWSQTSFQLAEGKNKMILPFKTTANLIIIPASINGVELNFILDSGSERTLIFDFIGIDSIKVNKGRILRYQGANRDNYFEAYYSNGNKITVQPFLENLEAEVLIMTDGNFNLSSQLGIPIHGVIGADFFKDLIIEVDYIRKTLSIYRPTRKRLKKLNKVTFLPLKIIDNKPYIESVLHNKNTQLKLDLLLDTGSSDALWLYDTDSLNFSIPVKGFNDYLGYGLAGDINGRRSKIDQFSISDFNFDNPTIAFPIKTDSMIVATKFKSSNGSVGGGILSRFNVIYDYKNNRIAFERNSDFYDGFYYNMSGIQLKSEGIELELAQINKWVTNNDQNSLGNNQVYAASPSQVVKILPKLIVHQVKENSPAYFAGIRKGDQILKINSKKRGSLSLGVATDFFYKKPYSFLKIRYKREEEVFKTRFQLIPLLE